MFCAKCGRLIEENNEKCPYCEYKADDEISTDRFYIDHKSFERPKAENVMPDCNVTEQKSRLTAGLLQIFLGAFGVGRFYMGDIWVAIGQIAATLFSCGIAGFVWGIIDGVMILNENVKM